MTQVHEVKGRLRSDDTMPTLAKEDVFAVHRVMMELILKCLK